MGAISSVNLLKNCISADQAKDLVSMLKEHPTLKPLCCTTGNETELNMRGKMNGAGDAIMLAAEIIDNGTSLFLDIKFLDISNNSIGELVDVDVAFEPTGKISGKYDYGIISSTQAHDGQWSIVLTRDGKKLGTGTLNSLNEGSISLPSMGGEFTFTFDKNTDTLTFSDGDKWAKKAQQMPLGIIAIADAIPYMGAMTSLNLASNKLGVEGAKIIAACLPKCT
jgi:hypothetical protein